MLTCQFEDGGKTTNLRHLTAIAIVIKNNKILLGKRGTYNNGKPLLESGKWALLGGFVSRDETLKEAVIREVEEESGWKISEIELFQINDNPNRPGEDRQNISVVFLAKADLKVSNSNEETTNLEWFDLENIPPKNIIAFDHWESLQLYKKYIQEKFNLPLIGKVAI